MESMEKLVQDWEVAVGTEIRLRRQTMERHITFHPFTSSSRTSVCLAAIQIYRNFSGSVLEVFQGAKVLTELMEVAGAMALVAQMPVADLISVPVTQAPAKVTTRVHLARVREEETAPMEETERTYGSSDRQPPSLQWGFLRRRMTVDIPE